MDATESVERFLKQQPATTFVSGASTKPKIEFREEELFRPETGGMAYKSVRALRNDGWGVWHLGVEVNTGRYVLIRTFNPGLLATERMKFFFQEICDLGFNMSQGHILENEELVMGPNRTPGIIHQLLPRTLERMITKNPGLSLATRIEVIRKITSALAYSHDYVALDGKHKRTFHLQLQPSDVLVSDKWEVLKVTSFGIVQAYRGYIVERTPRWKDPGMNAAYMPPEFFRLKALSISEKAADVYALGAIMYLVITGEPVFEGPSFEDYKFQHTRVFPAPPRLVNPSAPAWLEPLILACLEKDPEKRTTTPEEILKIIEEETGRKKT